MREEGAHDRGLIKTHTNTGVGLFVGVLTSLCHSNGHIETMPAREINPLIQV